MESYGLIIPLGFHQTKLAFPMGRDSATFWDKGTEVPSLSRDKGTTGQTKNLAEGRDGPGRARTAKIRDGTGRDNQNPGCGTKRDRAKKDVLKQGKDVLKQKRTF